MALKRYQLDDQKERLVIDARIAPFAPFKYDWLGSVLGPATADRIVAKPDDPLTVQISLQKDLASHQRSNDFYQLFGIVENQDVDLASLQVQGIFQTLEMLRSLPAYIGAHPSPGVLDRWLLGFRNRNESDGFNYSRLLDLWRLDTGEFALMGFNRKRLESAASQLHVVPGDSVAQLRLHVADLNQTKVAGLANWLFYRRAWKTSLTNVQWVNHVAHKFQLPAEGAWATAESIVGARFVCPLGGEYQFDGAWKSSAWPSWTQPRVPADYHAPLLRWFRGIDAEVIQTENQFVVHGTMDVQRETQTSPNGLPSFNLFKGFDPIRSLSELLKANSEPSPREPDPSPSK